MSKVSIIIPTRNRAHLLRFALKSAVQQTYDSIEIVVCDNYSNDGTKEVVDSFKQSFPKRDIVYVRTDKGLSMPKNWEFALGHSSGDFIVYLSDDTYLLPTTVETAIKKLREHPDINVAVWKHCSYFATDWVEPGRQNIVYIPRTTSKSYVMDSYKNLQRLYAWEEEIAPLIPKSYNSIIHRSIINKVMGIQGSLFLSPASCPDYILAAGILLNTDKYLLIDQALYIDGVTSDSIGATAGFNFGKSAQNMVKEFGTTHESIFFLGIPTNITAVAKSLEIIQKFYPDRCPKIDENLFLKATVDRLRKLESNGADVQSSWNIVDKYLITKPMGFKFNIFLQKIISKLKWSLMKMVRFSPALEFIEQLRGITILRGSKWRFHNIEECANLVVRKVARARNAPPLPLIIFLALTFIFLPSTAQAYLDPGAGGMLIQAIMAGIAGVGVLIKIFFKDIKKIFDEKIKRKK